MGHDMLISPSSNFSAPPPIAALDFVYVRTTLEEYREIGIRLPSPPSKTLEWRHIIDPGADAFETGEGMEIPSQFNSASLYCSSHAQRDSSATNCEVYYVNTDHFTQTT